MVNFYSTGTSFYGYQAPVGNLHQVYKNRYGVGYEDFGTRPYVQPCPMGYIQRCQPVKCEDSKFLQFIKKYLL